MMTQDETRQVEGYYTRTEAALASGASDERLSLASEIEFFELAHGGSLDMGTRDQLDAAIDHLRNGMPQPAEPQQSALGAGLRSWWNDPNKLDPSVLKDTAKKLIPDVPGGWTIWLVGLGALALLIGVGYSSRGVKELVKG